jgi:GNAT superfamily N-acetyltransferase
LTAPVPRLRQAGLDDVAAILDILAAAAADLTARFGDGHWSTVRAIETLQKYADNGDLYVVEANSISVGTLRLTDRKIGFYKQDWFARPQDPAGYLIDMAVHPHHQRRGIGRRSMQLTEQLARRAGLRAIRLDAYQGPAGAGEFYKKCGYALVHAGEFKGVALEYFEKLLAPRA